MSVSGNVAPDIVKPVPDSEAPLIVSAAVPEELRVSVCLAGVFKATLPKGKLAALRVSVGVFSLVLVPVPLRVTVAVPLAELLVIAIWPLAAPAVVGSNWTDSEAVWPGLSVTGNAAPGIVNPVPDKVAALTVRGAVPDEVRVKVCRAGVFRATLPNARLAALTVRFGAVGDDVG